MRSYMRRGPIRLQLFAYFRSSSKRQRIALSRSLLRLCLEPAREHLGLDLWPSRNKARNLSDVGFAAKAQKHDSDDLRPYAGRTEFRNPASLAVALYCGIGSSSLNALVNAFERLHIVRGWNSS